MIELFLFSWGAETRRYTTSRTPVLWGGHTWEPAAITRGRVKLEASIKSAGVTVDLSVDGDVPGLFKARAPLKTVGLTIYRGDESDLAGTTLSIWMGEVAKVAFGPTVATLTCEPTISIGRGRLPIGRFTVGCRWQVYSTACGLDVSAWVEPVEITSLAPTLAKVTIAPQSRYSGQDLIGGFYVDADGERHLIIDAFEFGDSSIELTFDKMPSDATLGELVQIVPGCNHTLAVCKQFANEHNFGGFPAIPDRT